MNNGKGLLQLGAFLAAGGGLIYLGKRLSQQDEPPPPEGIVYAASIGTLVNGAVQNSPYELEEGASYLIEVAVTNNSYAVQLGVITPWSAQLGVRVQAKVYPFSLIDLWEDKHTFGPGDTHIFPFTITVPVGSQGAQGDITVDVYDPFFQDKIASDSEILVVALELVPGSGVDIIITRL